MKCKKCGGSGSNNETNPRLREPCPDCNGTGNQPESQEKNMVDRKGKNIEIGDRLIHVDRPRDISPPIREVNGVLYAGEVKVELYHSSVIEIVSTEESQDEMGTSYIVFEKKPKIKLMRQISIPFESLEEAESFIETMKLGKNYKTIHSDYTLVIAGFKSRDEEVIGLNTRLKRSAQRFWKLRAQYRKKCYEIPALRALIEEMGNCWNCSKRHELSIHFCEHHSSRPVECKCPMWEKET